MSSKKLVVFYNKFDVDAVITAALLKTVYNIEHVYDNLSNRNVVVDSDTDCYVLGFNKVSNSMQRYKPIVVNQTQGNETNDFVPLSILSKIVKHITPKLEELGYAIDVATELGELLCSFYKKELISRELLLIYIHYQNAIKVLKGVEYFTFRNSNLSDVASFESFIKEVKSDIVKYSSKDHIICKQYGLNAMASSNTCETAPWVRRMVSMTHGAYVNIVLSIHGIMVDSNLTNIAEILKDKEYILSTDFV